MLIQFIHCLTFLVSLCLLYLKQWKDSFAFHSFTRNSILQDKKYRLSTLQVNTISPSEPGRTMSITSWRVKDSLHWVSFKHELCLRWSHMCSPLMSINYYWDSLKGKSIIFHCSNTSLSQCGIASENCYQLILVWHNVWFVPWKLA